METVMAIATAAWVFANSPAGIALIASVAVFIMNAVYARKPEWKKYEGTIIAAIKRAEKAIPDDADNKSAARLDAALRYVIAVYAAREGREPTAAQEAALIEAIQIKHADIEGPEIL
jgi:hypothetical protein